MNNRNKWTHPCKTTNTYKKWRRMKKVRARARHFLGNFQGIKRGPENWVTQLGKLKKDGWNYWLEAKLTIYHHLPSNVHDKIKWNNENFWISDYRLEELDEQWKTTSSHDGIVQKQSNTIIESDGRIVKMGIATHRGQNCLGSIREPNDVQEKHYVSFSSDCGKLGCNLQNSRHMCIWISI